ncbi:unnamed protein product, partial [Cyprideis torosa]
AATRREGVHEAVRRDVVSIFKGKSSAQLDAMRQQMERKIRSGDESVDVTYWESLLSQLKAHMARTRLRERHQEGLKKKLERLREQQALLPSTSFAATDAPVEAPPVPEEEEAKGGPLAEREEEVGEEDEDELEEGEGDGGDDDPVKTSLKEYVSGSYSPKCVRPEELEPGTILIDPDEDFKRLEYARGEVLKKGKKIEVRVPRVSFSASVVTAEEKALAAEARKGMTDEEAQFSVEQDLGDAAYLWSDKYRPRKPRYFNRTAGILISCGHKAYYLVLRVSRGAACWPLPEMPSRAGATGAYKKAENHSSGTTVFPGSRRRADCGRLRKQEGCLSPSTREEGEDYRQSNSTLVETGPVIPCSQDKPCPLSSADQEKGLVSVVPLRRSDWRQLFYYHLFGLLRLAECREASRRPRDETPLSREWIGRGKRFPLPKHKMLIWPLSRPEKAPLRNDVVSHSGNTCGKDYQSPTLWKSHSEVQLEQTELRLTLCLMIVFPGASFLVGGGDVALGKTSSPLSSKHAAKPELPSSTPPPEGLYHFLHSSSRKAVSLPPLLLQKGCITSSTPPPEGLYHFLHSSSRRAVSLPPLLLQKGCITSSTPPPEGLVHTGFEWNKYNQTHYDIDNPPPKIVQGYKFNIFYPDLIDKGTAPSYSLSSDEDNRDFAILRFTAGPPYEDIAFKIVNREWEYSYRKGFRCQFQNNIFQLWFHFKRYRYRR